MASRFSRGRRDNTTFNSVKTKYVIVATKVTKPKPRAMAQQVDAGDGNVQMEDESTPIGGRKACRSKTEESSSDPGDVSKSVSSESQSWRFRSVKTEQDAAEPASHSNPKRVSDVVIQLSPKDHARILMLEKDNRKLRNRNQMIASELQKAQQALGVLELEAKLEAGAVTEPQLEADLAAQKAQADDEISKLKKELENERAQSTASSELQKVISQLETTGRTAEQTSQRFQRDLERAQRENQTLCDELKRKGSTIKLLNEQKAREREAKDNAKAETYGFRQKCQQLENERNAYAADCLSKDKKIREHDHEILILQRKVKYHQELSQKASAENKELRTHVEQQELSVTKAQKAAMNVLSVSLSASLPDDRIRPRFRELFERIAEWARDNASADRAIFNSENIQDWHRSNLLRHVGRLGDQPNLEFDAEDDTAIDTLLNAALSRRLCQRFLKNPFWFAEGFSPVTNVTASEEDRVGTDLALERLLKKLMGDYEGHEAEVHAWRAATVKTLSGSAHAQEKIMRAQHKYLDEKLLKFCEQFLSPDLPQEAKEELLGIVTAFGKLAIDLWSEKYHVKYFCLNAFEDRVYKASDKEMELAQAVGLGDGDSSLDGRPIPCVVQPLIVGYGTHDGKEYGSKGRVWSPAVVWVSKAGRPIPSKQVSKRRWY